MSDTPRVWASIWAGQPWVYHISSNLVIGERDHYLCTSGCRKIWTWYYQVCVDGKVVAEDNTGAWQPMFEQAMQHVRNYSEVIASGNTMKEETE